MIEANGVDITTEFLMVLGGYLFIAIVIIGVIREHTGSWSATPAALAWPIFPPVIAVLSVGWALAWLGRAPTRLLVRRARRKRQAERLVRAEVRRG